MTTMSVHNVRARNLRVNDLVQTDVFPQILSIISVIPFTGSVMLFELGDIESGEYVTKFTAFNEEYIPVHIPA
jgi:hypothetical protein